MISVTDYLAFCDRATAVKTCPDNEQVWRDFMDECDRIQKMISDFYCTANDDDIDRAELMSEAWDVIHTTATDLGGYSDPKEWYDSVVMAEQWVTLGIGITCGSFAYQMTFSEGVF